MADFITNHFVEIRFLYDFAAICVCSIFKNYSVFSRFCSNKAPQIKFYIFYTYMFFSQNISKSVFYLLKKNSCKCICFNYIMFLYYFLNCVSYVILYVAIILLIHESEFYRFRFLYRLKKEKLRITWKHIYLMWSMWNGTKISYQNLLQCIYSVSIIRYTQSYKYWQGAAFFSIYTSTK